VATCESWVVFVWSVVEVWRQAPLTFLFLKCVKHVFYFLLVQIKRQTVYMQVKISKSMLISEKMGRPAKSSQPNYGKHLAELRKNANLTQSQLAAAINVRQSNIAFWERSSKPPRGEMIPKLAEALSLYCHVPLLPLFFTFFFAG
jgi:DNA-binding transcriptional regulator YiaG